MLATVLIYFQIFIQADNFVFHSANLEGGFAIIDSIEYYADLCADSSMMPLNVNYKFAIVL